MSTRPTRTFLTLLMDLLIVLAVLVTSGIIIAFFGSLSAQTWAKAVLKIADLVTIPFGFGDIKTPYGGYFAVNAGIMVALLLVGEWVLSVARQRA